LEKGEFDLPRWVEEHFTDELRLSAVAWQELMYGVYAWESTRAQKRLRYLEELRRYLTVCNYGRRQADRAARIAAELKSAPIGFSDCQVAATALEDDAELLSFNTEHFSRVAGLRLAKV
jgi:predicted nucleic acid-binding protein